MSGVGMIRSRMLARNTRLRSVKLVARIVTWRRNEKEPHASMTIISYLLEITTLLGIACVIILLWDIRRQLLASDKIEPNDLLDGKGETGSVVTDDLYERVFTEDNDE